MIEKPKSGKIEKVIGIARGGLAFAKLYRFLGKSQWWPKERLQEYQLGQLKSLLSHAYEQVPYYHNQWLGLGIHPEDIKSLSDIKHLPFTTKQLFQENLDTFSAANFRQSKIDYVTTGGSTGIPFGFFEEKHIAWAREAAFISRLWNRVGYRPGDKRVILRGKVVRGADNGQFVQYDLLHSQLSLSSYHMIDENLPHYIDMIKKFRAPFIHTYPSAITILADFMIRNKIRPFPFLKAILAGSENLYDWQRDLLQEAFQCCVYNWYGHAEKAVLAGECEECHHYHIFPEYGITELLDENGNEVTREGQVGEIVATGFNNYAMPFIRYRTMDLGVYGGEHCACGRNYSILKRIEGRLQELIITGDNRLISMTAINMHNDLFDNVRQFQFYQEKKGEVILNLVKAPSYSGVDDARIEAEIGEKLGKHIRLNLNFVAEIPRTPSGKFRFLIQKLPIGQSAEDVKVLDWPSNKMETTYNLTEANTL